MIMNITVRKNDDNQMHCWENSLTVKDVAEVMTTDILYMQK